MTTDPQVMLTWLKALSVSGGGDCAEYAMSGMLLGKYKIIYRQKIILYILIITMNKFCIRMRERE